MMVWKNTKLKLCGKILISFCVILITVYRFIAYKLDDFFSYGEFTPGNLVELIFSVLSVAIICGLLCYSIFNLEKYYVFFRTKANKKGILIALYFAVSFTLSLSPLDPALINVKGYNRIFGAGYLAGEDVSRRISSFVIWIALFAGSFALLFLFVNYLLNQETENKDRKSSFEFLRNFMVVANCCLIFRGVLFFQTETNQLATINDFTTKAVLLIGFICLIYPFCHLERTIRFSTYLQLQFVMFCFSFPILIVSGMKWHEGNMLFGFWLLMTIIANGILIIRNRKHQIELGNIKQRRFTFTLIIAAMIPFFTSAYIEMIHVLNQWNVYVGKPILGYSLIICGLIILGLMWDIKKRNVTESIQRSARLGNYKWMLAIFVFGMACLSTQIQLTSGYDFDLFEGANYGVLINDMLNYGKIPIIEHYGGHQMTSVWSGLLYGLLNRDFAAAYVVPYINLATVVMAVIFFLLIRELWEEKMAVLVALLIPYNHMWSYYGMGIIVCLTAVAFIRKNTFPKAVLFWLSCIWCVTYRLDLGFAFCFPAVIVLVVYMIRTKNRDAGKKLLITFVIEGLITAGLWFICCVAKKINPVSRLKEFLALGFSNQNWAYQGIGNTAEMAFSWFYLFLPFAVIFGILCVAFSEKIRKNLTYDKWSLALILGFAFLFNFSRGLVRHSLHEKQTFILAFTGYLFLSYVVSIWMKNKKLFLPIFAILLICNNLLITGSNFSISAIAESSVTTPASIVESWTDTVYPDPEDGNKKITYWEYLQHNKQKVNRVNISEKKQNIAQTYSILLDLLLEDDETFVDFTNVATLYPLLNRKNPMYISQSPAMLSGEFSQEEFIREIEGVPLIIMPGTIDISGLSNKLDGISNNFHYYKVSEYIYQKYIPLCKYSEKYTLWCLKNMKDSYTSKLSKVINEGLEYKDKLINNDKIIPYRINMSQDSDGSVVLSVTDADPFITNMEKALDIRAIAGTNAEIIMDYSTEQTGTMEIFYTTEQSETITGQKVATIPVSDSGTAEFQFPVTEHTILRFDIPDAGIVRIHSMRMKLPIELIDYGYDGPFENKTDSGETIWHYNGIAHEYSLNQLPLYWGEYDNRKATDNAVLCEAKERDGVYIFDSRSVDKTKGNYIKLHISWEGHDSNGQYKEEDESFPLHIIIGQEENETFKEKYRFVFTVKEGNHDYLIRCSSDYYWYKNEINAIKIASSESLHNMMIKILEGD